MSQNASTGSFNFLLMLLVTLLLQSASLDARSESGKLGGGHPTPLAMDQKYHDVNNVRLVVKGGVVVKNTM